MRTPSPAAQALLRRLITIEFFTYTSRGNGLAASLLRERIATHTGVM